MTRQRGAHARTPFDGRTYACRPEQEKGGAVHDTESPVRHPRREPWHQEASGIEDAKYPVVIEGPAQSIRVERQEGLLELIIDDPHAKRTSSRESRSWRRQPCRRGSSPCTRRDRVADRVPVDREALDPGDDDSGHGGEESGPRPEEEDGGEPVRLTTAQAKHTGCIRVSGSPANSVKAALSGTLGTPRRRRLARRQGDQSECEKPKTRYGEAASMKVKIAHR